MPALLIVVPLLGILVLNLPLKNLMNRVAFWLGMLMCACQAVLSLRPAGRFWTEPSEMLTGFLGWSASLDHLSFVMFLSVAIVGFVSLWVGQYAIKDENQRFNFVNLSILALIGMNGVVLSNDLFSLYVFLEITAVASYILIALQKGRDAFEGAFKYIVLSAVATTMILSALALLMMVAGGVAFGDVANALKTGGNPVAILAVALFVVGLFIKSGLVPFHGWLPDAYSSAPSAVSVLLAGIVTKTTGVYTLIRLVHTVFGFSEPVKMVLLVIGMASILIGAFAALGQSDFKRMLAYSSISQVGYIILGLGTGTELGIAGAIFHLFNHSIFKSLLFVNSAAVEQETGTRNMDQLGGIANRMPVTGTTSVIAFLSTAGIPPLSGFWSKVIIVLAVWKAGHHALAGIAILASLVTLAYFLSMQRRVFFGKLAEGMERIKEANFWVVFPAVLLASITIGVGVGFPWIFETFLMPVRSILW